MDNRSFRIKHDVQYHNTIPRNETILKEKLTDDEQTLLNKVTAILLSDLDLFFN